MTALQLTWTDALVSRRAALAEGRSPDEVRALLRGGAWTALRPGQSCPTAVLEAADPGRRHHLELLALLRQLDRPGAVLARSTAGHLHGLLLPTPRGRQVQQLIDPGRTRHGDGYRMTRAALPTDQVTRLGPFQEDQLRAVGTRVVRPTVTDVFGGWPALHARVDRMVAAPAPRLEAFTAVPRAAGWPRPGAPRWAAYPLA